MFRFLVSLAVLLCSMAGAQAQSHTSAMDRLAQYEGTYSLDGIALIEEGSFDGALTVSPILGGHFQQWDWTMTMRGDGAEEQVYLRFIAAYDHANDAYVIHRFDSRDAGAQTAVRRSGDSNRGRLYFEGDALVMSWQSTNPDDASQTGELRNTVRLNAGGLRVKTDAKPDDGTPHVAIATVQASRR
ncbi:MAG: hypothetical protein AAF752_02810 [Bacteroidota bacterium]